MNRSGCRRRCTLQKTTLRIDYARGESVRVALEVLAEAPGFATTAPVVSARDSECEIIPLIARRIQSPGEDRDGK